MERESPQNGRKHTVRNSLAAMLLAGTALAGYAAGRGVLADPAPATTTANSAPSGAIQPSGTQTLIPDFANLVSEVTPAVVSIRTELKASEAADVEDGDPDGMP